MARIVAACLLLLAILGAAQADTISTMARAANSKTLFVLGDSFSDNGNAWNASNHTLPSAAQGYSNGRFSDGPVWNDYIATNYNITVFNTGYPGAQACPPSTPNAGFPFFVPYLAQQANITATHSVGLGPNRAAFIWAGANDLSGLAQGLLGGSLNYSAASAAIPSINACIRQTAEGLLKYGIVKSLTISTVQNIALQPIWSVALATYGVPAAAGQGLLTNIGALVRQLNAGILTDASALAATYRHARVSTFDMYGQYESLVTDGPALGLTNVTAACLDVTPWYAASGDPSNNVTGTCSTPGQHMFWDYSHPTTHTHQFLSTAIQAHLATSSDLFY